VHHRAGVDKKTSLKNWSESMVLALERRSTSRYDLRWPVSMWHPEAEQFFHVQSVNISRNGAMLRVGIKTPLQLGQVVELNFPRTKALASQHGCFARNKLARVVRVDELDYFFAGEVAVALEFVNTLSPLHVSEPVTEA
jgi:hypothetical protein